jgi:hypothetical protein
MEVESERLTRRRPPARLTDNFILCVLCDDKFNF